MMNIEVRNTVESTLLEHRREILAMREFVEMIPEASELGKRTIVENAHHLISNGGLTREKYREVLGRCVQRNDFTELALLFNEFELNRWQERLREHPEDDALILALAGLRGAIRGIHGEHFDRTAIRNIGNPGLRDVPDWVIAIEQSGMTLEEIYTILENQPPQAPGKIIINEGVNETRKGVDGIV